MQANEATTRPSSPRRTAQSKPLATIESYEAAADQWTLRDVALEGPRTGPPAFRLEDRLLIAGGAAADDVSGLISSVETMSIRNLTGEPADALPASRVVLSTVPSS